MNADDNHDTAGGLNNQPDTTLFADRDFVYGGDGLDVLIANTGGDRMFDWGGEFNSYIVPFSPFGHPTISRSPSPHVQQFLLDLGRASGADQTLTEPNGELGLFTQSDPEWGQNHGGPRDPQPGNTHARRDTRGGPEDDRNTALPLQLYSGATAAASSTAQGNSTDVTVNNVVVTPDPSDPSRLALFVGGGSGNDTIEIRRGVSAAMIRVVVNGATVGEFARTGSAGTIGRVIVYGNDGNDTITIYTDLAALTAVLYGDAGNDTLRGGNGTNVIDGGDGDDNLFGGAAADLMFGGLGQDNLFGGNGDDVLVGGVYVSSEDLDAVAAVLAEWTSAQPYNQRIANLRAGVGTGADALNTSPILDDATADTLTGDKDQDWFWVFTLDRTDARGNETTN
jgi:Ca2+-binding RTX toxin-like protein